MKKKKRDRAGIKGEPTWIVPLVQVTGLVHVSLVAEREGVSFLLLYRVGDGLDALDVPRLGCDVQGRVASLVPRTRPGPGHHEPPSYPPLSRLDGEMQRRLRVVVRRIQQSGMGSCPYQSQGDLYEAFHYRDVEVSGKIKSHDIRVLIDSDKLTSFVSVARGSVLSRQLRLRSLDLVWWKFLNNSVEKLQILAFFRQ